MRKLAALLSLALVGAAEAYACTLRTGRPRARPAAADGAFVGTVLERTVRGGTATYLFRVEQVYKGEIENRVEVVTAGRQRRLRARARGRGPVGLLLTREGDVWRSGLCSQVDPAEFLALTDVEDNSAAADQLGRDRRRRARPRRRRVLPRPEARGSYRALAVAELGHGRSLELVVLAAVVLPARRPVEALAALVPLQHPEDRLAEARSAHRLLGALRAAHVRSRGPSGRVEVDRVQLASRLGLVAAMRRRWRSRRPRRRPRPRTSRCPGVVCARAPRARAAVGPRRRTLDRLVRHQAGVGGAPGLDLDPADRIGVVRPSPAARCTTARR